MSEFHTTMRHWPAAILLGAACAFAASADDSLPAVWAIGLPHGYIVMEQQARLLEISEEHVAQGFVEVANGSRLIVSARTPADYALQFAVRRAMFRSVQVEGAGRRVELGAQGGTVVTRDAPAGKSVLVLTYRFRLAPGTIPGTYAWPLEIVARGALPADFIASESSPASLALSGRPAR